MIAAFLKDIDGNFNIPGLVFSIPLVIVSIAVLSYLPKAFRAGRIHFEWTPRTANTIKCDFERRKNPTAFWLLFWLYCFGSILSLGLAIVISFGLFRKGG